MAGQQRRPSRVSSPRSPRATPARAWCATSGDLAGATKAPLRPRPRPWFERVSPWRARHARAHAADRGSFRLRLLRPAGKLHEHAQRLHDRTGADHAAADGAETVLAMEDAAVAGGDGEMDEAHRLAGRGAAGAGDAGDRYGEIDAGALQRADGHLRRGLLADG